jgi:Ca-activated chloride channel family protein
MRRVVPALVLMLAVSSAAASAQADDPPPDRALLLILDASGSMDRLDEDGVRLIDGAKEALLDLLDGLPDDVLVGLRVYGHRYPNTDPVNGCTDTELVVPIGPLDRDAMADAIGGFDAQGFTPIGLSLQEAATDFPPDVATKAIVLVSDGEDTCAPPDPCEIAGELFSSGVFVRIETVGLVLGDDDARGQLQCIAEATGGTYHDIGTIDLLAQELDSIAGAAIEGPIGFLLGGLTKTQATAVPNFWSGAEPSSGEDGMALLAAGTYRIPVRQGQTLWFSLALEDLQAASLYAVLSLPENVAPSGHLEIAVLDDAGDEVAGDRPDFGPRRSLISERPAVWATMEEVGDISGRGPPQYLPGVYNITIAWDAPPADAAGEIELMVEILEATGQYAEQIIESRPPDESPEAETTTTAGTSSTTATSTTRVSDAVEVSTSAPDAGEDTDESVSAEAGPEDEHASGSLLPIVVAVAAILLVAAGAGAWWIRRRQH